MPASEAKTFAAEKSFASTMPASAVLLACQHMRRPASSKSLLIDTGYALTESRRDLDAGMKALDLRPENTDIFLTHIHSDHAGNAAYLAKRGYHIIMGERDYHGVIASHLPGFYGAKEKAVDAGVPKDVFDAIFVHNPSPIMLPEPFPAELVKSGRVLEYGGLHLECLPTYGHSPGHISLYDAEKETLFLGDHILFDISPNIVLWTWNDDALGTYLENLRFVKKLPVKLALPAHRGFGDISLATRVDELIEHHQRRLGEISLILRQTPGLTCYEIAARMKWSIRAACWSDFPPSQKYFAVCECMAHLQHMLCLGLLNCNTGADGVMRYYGI